MPNDQFAQIAADGIGGRMELLETPQPVRYQVKKCILDTCKLSPLPTDEKISSKEQLYSELSALKKQYQPYLEDHAPHMESCKQITKLTHFVLNGCEEITLPHRKEKSWSSSLPPAILW